MISERLRTGARSADLATPFYLFDLAAVEGTTRSMIQAWQDKFPQFTLAYSYKTNPLPGITRLLRACGAAAEVVSEAELDAALADGFTASQVYFDGPVKLPHELERAVAAGVAIQVDCLAEVDKLADLATQGATPRVSLRVAAPRGRRHWSRFGLLPGEVQSARQILTSAGVPVRGIHFNTGLHPLDAGPYRRVLRNWRTLLQDLRKEAAEPLMVDIGGGFPAASCAPGTQLPHWSTYAAAVAAECRALGLPPEDLHLVIEPGRSLVEDHAVLVTSVAVKKERDRRHVVVVDAGTNLARSISGWHHTVEFLDPGDVQYDIYGSMCYESDQFQRRVLGPPVLRAGDRVLIGAVGGYDIPSANIWVRHRPAIYALSDAGNEFTCLRGPSAEIR